MESTTALTLPDEHQFKADLVAITKFQQTCQELLLKGHDYGVIPGTQKPTLLKPGAEKITKILGLSDKYDVTQRVEDWDRGFFHYEVKCILTHLGTGVVISEGLGSCNSKESKYRWRWVFPNDVPEGIDHTKLLKKTGSRRDGKGTFVQYRLDNDDIFSQVNTLLKMAEKRSLVDAALHAGRLSDLFTQDIEDIHIGSDEETRPPVVKDTKAPPAPPAEDKGPDENPIKDEKVVQSDLETYIFKRMKWKDAKPVRTWIINKCGISEERIDSDPDGVLEEVKALMGWTD